MSEVHNVFFAKSLGHARHISRIVCAVTGFKVAQLFHDIVVLLAGNAGYFILTLEL